MVSKLSIIYGIYTPFSCINVNFIYPLIRFHLQFKNKIRVHRNSLMFYAQNLWTDLKKQKLKAREKVYYYYNNIIIK